MAVIWISSMALAGFFLPVFVDTLPYFKVKAIEVEGNTTIPTYVFSQAVGELKNNWLFITENTLLEKLNYLTDNSVEDVKVDRVFQKDGVILRLHVKDRTPFLMVFDGEKKVFFDDKGVPFFSKYIPEKKPYIYTHSVKLVKDNFPMLKKLLEVCKSYLPVKDIYLSDVNTLVYTTNNIKVLLPPLEQMDYTALKRLERIYNISMEAKEIDLTTQGMAIIKGGE
ncbi:MAG: cell division protein FtsQ/DivIB [Hydrogenobacter sp.]